MNNEAKLEIEQTTAALQAMPAAIDKVVAGVAKLSRQQGTLKTTGKESLDALRAMQAGINGFGSGLAGVADAVKDMNASLSSAMREMAATISMNLKRGLDDSETVARKSGKSTGEAYVKALKKAIAEDKVVALPPIRAPIVTQTDIRAGTALALREGLVTSGTTLALAELEGAKVGDAYAKGLSARLQGLAALKSKTGIARAVDQMLAGVKYTPAVSAAAVSTVQDTSTAAAAAANAAAHNNLAKAAAGSKLALADNAAGMKIWTGHANDAHSAARGLASGFGAMWLTWGNILPLLAGAAVSHTIAGVVKQGADVNHIMETMRVLTGQTTQETEGLNNQLLQMSRTGPLGPKDVAEAMKQLALAGLNASQVSAALVSVKNLSVAGDVSMKESADALSQLGTAFNIPAHGYNQIADVIAKTAAISRASVGSIAEGMKAASVVHEQYGASLKDAAFGIAMLNNLGIQGSSAGVALRNFYVDLSGRTAASRKELKRLKIDVLDSRGDMLDMLSIFKNLDEGLRRVNQKDEKLSIQKIFSERGSKLSVQALNLYRSAALNPDYANRGTELKAEQEDSLGFAAINAAKLSTTAANQIKTTLSSLKASMVDAFSAAEPYILSISAGLRNMFNSQGFKDGLSNLIVGVGSLTKFLVDHGQAILYVGLAYAALKTGQLVLNLGAVASAFVASTAAARVNATILAANTTAEAKAAAVTAAKAAATEAAAKASAAGVAGAHNTAVAAGGAATMLSKWGAAATTLITWLSRLTVVLGVLSTAWVLYDTLRSGGEAAKAKEDAWINKIRAENEELERNAKALQAVNEARARGVSVEQLKDAQNLASNRGELENIAEQLRQAKKALSRWESSPLGNRKGQSVSAPALSLERDLQIADAKAVVASLEAKYSTGSAEVRRQEAIATEKIKAQAKATADANAAQESMVKKLKDAKDRGDEGPPIVGEFANLSLHDSERLSRLSQTLDREMSVLRDADAKTAAALADKHRNHLISDAAFYVQRSILSDQAYANEKAAIADRYAKEDSAATAAQRRSLSKLGIANADNISEEDVKTYVDKFINMTSDEFTRRFADPIERKAANTARTDVNAFKNYKEGILSKRDEAAGKLEADRTLQQEQANNALAGSYRTIEMSIESLDKQMLGHHAQIMGEQSDSVVPGLFESPWAKAAREQHKATIKKYAGDIARQQESIDIEDRRSQANLAAALDSGNFESYVKALDERAQAITRLAAAQEILDNSKNQSQIFASQQADAARQTAFKNEVLVVQRNIASGVASSISTAIFEGGASGGVKLRKFLEETFIRKPFEIVVQAAIEDIFKSESLKSVGAGLFNWAKGGLGSLMGGGVKSDTTVDEFGQVVEAQKGVFATLASSLSALFSTTTPTTVTAATTSMSASTLMMSAATTMSFAASTLAASAVVGGASSGGGLSSLVGFAAMFGGGGSSSAAAAGSSGSGLGLSSGGSGLGLRPPTGLADGGQASPFSIHQVNENGAELLSMGGKDYLMTGAQGGTVTSVRDMPSGGSTIQHSVVVNIDSRTDQAQVHALVMGAVQRGNAQLVDQLQQSGALAR